MGKLFRNKFFWIGIVVVVALGAGYFYYQSTLTPAEASTDEADMQTAVVRKGDLVISTTAAGTLISGEQADLNFPVSGTVAELNVQVGDQVTAGQVLAVLEEVDQLEATVASREVSMLQAQQALDDLYENADLSLGQAKQTLAVAQQNYEDAKDDILTSSMVRCDDDTSDEYYEDYFLAQQAIDDLSDLKDGYGLDYYLELVQPLEEERDTAYINWMYCSGYTEAEILESEANLQVAEAALAQAEVDYEAMIAANGIDPDELALAEANLTNAQLQLELAQENLEEATMVAPIDGTVMSIAAEEGESVSQSTFITISDLSHPYLEVYVDESDMDNFAVGYDAEIEFDALPDKIFKGVVTEIQPELVTFSGYSTIMGTVEMDASTLQSGQTLPLGLNATVDIIGGSVEDALLVPVEALRELDEDEYAVFVLENGTPKLRMVEVGLMDYTYAEIVSGLEEGEVVTTGIVETK